MKKYFAFILLYLTFLIPGCGNDPVTNNTQTNTAITVSGRVSDAFGSPVSGLSVLIGNQTVTSGADGSFTINNVNTPYDCQLLELSGNFKYGNLFKGLTTASPHLTITSGLANPQYSSNIVVTFPAGLIPAGKKVLLFYSDTTSVILGKISSGPVIASETYSLQWANNTSTVEGKIRALVYSVDVSNNIISYDNYAEAVLPVTSGLQSVWQPTMADFVLNPGEESLIATINPPGGYSIINAILCINFSKLSNNPFFLIFGAGISIFTGTPNISSLVPTGLPSSFKLNLFVRISEPSGGGGYKSTIVQAGINNQVNLDPASILNTPLNGATGIDTTTVFNYSQGSGSGMYSVQFSGFNNTYTVYTSSLNATIPNFSPNLNIEPNTSHSWKVFKYQGVNTVDEFVNIEMYHRTDLPGIMTSAGRTFTTAP